MSQDDKGKEEEEPDNEMWDWANEETDGSFDSEYAHIPDKETKIGAQAASIIIDLVPFAGTAKGVLEVITGKDPITGEKLNRFLAAVGVAASLIPFGKALLKAKKLHKITKLSQINKHIFRKAVGHVVPRTNASKMRWAKLFEKVASNPKNQTTIGLSKHAQDAGVKMYRKQFRNGKQVWVQYRNGKMQNAGVNVPGDKNYIKGLEQASHAKSNETKLMQAAGVVRAQPGEQQNDSDDSPVGLDEGDGVDCSHLQALKEENEDAMEMEAQNEVSIQQDEGDEVSLKEGVNEGDEVFLPEEDMNEEIVHKKEERNNKAENEESKSGEKNTNIIININIGKN
eukprot:CAMPEP_0201506722 /NCGR_PEP_ID=MMETSP0161_2-20130828/588_1 /ASSEMBLY_ACC=CAM_ASM_000251 /TAXON_ID=180227 /ORGANISM="Neoparamoeba aestuarina, Strain SoJaBio B1-5/56/2" /LENGTH=339 /DNA_ID=CAMNT_0047900895 /DNA_START=136 /DNA_END=1152 /DNA_ORIENTATION=-